MKLINSIFAGFVLVSVIVLSSCAIEAKRFNAEDFDTKIMKHSENDVVIFPKNAKPKVYSPGYYSSSLNYSKVWSKISKRKREERKIAAEKRAIKKYVELPKYDSYDDGDDYVYPGWWTYYNGPNTGFRKYYRQYYYYGGPYNTAIPGYNQEPDKRTRTTTQNGTVTYPYKGIYSKGKWTAAPGSTERPYPTHK